MARPKTFDPLDLAEKLDAYIASAYPFPILAEFAVVQDIDRSHLYTLADKCEELSYALKKCIAMKEVKLEKGMAIGEIPPGYGNFALKQLGWKDKTETEHSGGLQVTRIELPAKVPVGSPVFEND